MNLAQFFSIVALFVGAFGCSTESASERDAAEARAKAEAELVDAALADTPLAEAAVTRDGASRIIPSGTVLKVSLIDPLGSDTNSAGDLFMARMAEALVVDGTTVVSKGTKVLGRVVSVDKSGRVKGRASIRLVLIDIAQGERMVAITTSAITATAGSSTPHDAEIIPGVGGVGMVIGSIPGGKKGAGTGIDSDVGIGSDAGHSSSKEIRYRPQTRLNFTLTRSIEM